MFSLFKKSPQPTGDAIAFDLSVDSLRIAVFRIEEGGGARLLKKTVKDLPDRGHADGVAQLLAKEIREFIFHSIKESHRVPSRVRIGFPSDLLNNSIEIFSWDRALEKGGKRISEDEITSAFHSAVSDSAGGGAAGAVIRSAPLFVAVNGYEIDIHQEWPSPAGEHIEIRAFCAKMPKEIWQFFSDLPKMWGGIDFEFFALQELQAVLFSRILSVRDATFIDVSARMTEISFVKNGTLAFVAALPFGGRTITRRIADRLNLSFADAERLKSQLGRMLLPKDTEQKTRDIIAESLREWRGAWMEKIVLDPEVILPERIYLSGGGALSFGIASVFEDEQIKQELFVSAQPLVAVLDAASLADGRIAGEKLIGPGDVSLAALMLSDEKIPNHKR
jgi:hypothetical protein